MGSCIYGKVGRGFILHPVDILSEILITHMLPKRVKVAINYILAIIWAFNYFPLIFLILNNQQPFLIPHDASPNHDAIKLSKSQNKAEFFVFFTWLAGDINMARESTNIKSTFISPNCGIPVIYHPIKKMQYPTQFLIFSFRIQKRLDMCNTRVIAFLCKGLLNSSPRDS